MSVVLRAASLFSGVGGLDLGVRLATQTRTVVYVERDSYAAATLVARMEDEALDLAPVCADVTTFDGRAWRGEVDLVTAGFPCQDLSVAGRSAGLEDGERSSLWSEVIRIAVECEAPLIFLENVSAICSAPGRDVEDGSGGVVRERALGTVLRDLAEAGFDAEWITLRASDVGAPHRRERWFCLAYRDLDRSEVERCGGVLDGERAAQRHDADGCDEGMGNTDTASRGPDLSGRGSQERAAVGGAGEGVADATRVSGRERPRRERVLDDGEEPADTSNDGHERRGVTRRRWRGSEDEHGSVDDPASEGPQGHRQGLSTGADRIFPPGPTDHDAWRAVLEQHPHLAPAVEPGLCVLVDGSAVVVDSCRADQLRCCGNGVVPLQAGIAFAELLRRVMVERVEEEL